MGTPAGLDGISHHQKQRPPQWICGGKGVGNAREIDPRTLDLAYVTGMTSAKTRKEAREIAVAKRAAPPVTVAVE